MKNADGLTRRLRGFLYWPMISTLLLMLVNIPVYMLDIDAGFVLTVFIFIYFIISQLVYRYYKPMMSNELVGFATQYGMVQKKMLMDFEIPYAILSSEAKIMWMNQRFMEMTGKDADYHKSINGIFPTLTRELVQKTEDAQNVLIEREERTYRAYIKKMEFNADLSGSGLAVDEEDKDCLYGLYLFDETQLHQYIQENQEEKLVAGLVYVDNYDEVMDSIEEVRSSLLLALIDRKVNKYFTEADAIVRKVEKDKYFVVFRYKYLDKLQQDKFSLIEDVKTIKAGNERAVTLSIGIGYNADTYHQNYEYAHAAVDLALGRGGDQVVLKEENQITYYGGKSQNIDKNTRVKARVKAEALRELIASRDRVFIMGHRLADVDSFGAAIGIYCAAKVLGKQAQIVIDEVSTSLRPLVDCFTEDKGYPADMCINSETALHNMSSHSLVMVVDTNRPSYTECPELLDKARSVVVFDHHRQTSDVVENPTLSYIEPYASSTCEMIAEVLQYFTEKIKLEPREADAIYAGILIDTNNFMTKTGVRTFEAAAYLKRCGAEVTRVRKLLRNDMEAYKARAEAVRHAEVYHGKFAISVCPADNIENPTIVGAQAANELLNIIGIKASFVLTPYQGKIYISSRSIDEINVQIIMERFGGGGHINAAGAQLEDCTIEEAKITIQQTLEAMIEEGDIE